MAESQRKKELARNEKLRLVHVVHVVENFYNSFTADAHDECRTHFFSTSAPLLMKAVGLEIENEYTIDYRGMRYNWEKLLQVTRKWCVQLRKVTRSTTKKCDKVTKPVTLYMYVTGYCCRLHCCRGYRLHCYTFNCHFSLEPRPSSLRSECSTFVKRAWENCRPSLAFYPDFRVRFNTRIISCRLTF